jgi:hypothetical protein
MSVSLQIAAAAFAVGLYYIVVWLWVGRDPEPGTIVTRYDPPRGLSPALMRYCWKQRFDERVVWAGLTSLVSRGLADLETLDGSTLIKPVWPPKRKPEIPKEEAVLYSDLATARGRRGIPLSMADERMTRMALSMSQVLRSKEQGRWFVENRHSVLGGAILSLVTLLFSINPSNTDGVLALIIPSTLIAVCVFYLYFLVQRIFELLKVAREYFKRPITARLSVMLMLGVPCAAGVWIGCIILFGNFGWVVLGQLALLTAINLVFLHLMKAPTKEGRRLLDEIEGFRSFLNSVEHLPMNRPEGPGPKRGDYEKYLPYALALEVEQQWCDQVSAIASSNSRYEELQRSTVFHLGMWDGRPVDVAFRPEPRSH